MSIDLTAPNGEETDGEHSGYRESRRRTLHEGDGNGQFIRVIVADTQAIFRAGLRKIFALEDDVRVVGQAETLAQTLTAAKKFSADVLLFEAAIASNPIEAVADLLRQNPLLRLVVVTTEPDQDLTLELFRRGVHAIVSREVEPELLVDCLRKVSKGEPWLDGRATQWVLEAYRTQGSRAGAPRPKVQLTPKETLIVSCVTQGMKNKEIATARRNHRTGGQELSAQGLRQAGRRRSPGAGALLPE